MPSLKRNHHRLKIGMAVLFCAAAGTPLVGLSDRAQAATQFQSVANSAGVTMTVATGEDPTGTTIEGTGPVTTTVLSSLPDSEAFAADPYPGKDLLDLASVAGSSAPLPIPPYPTQAHSGSPGTPQRAVSEPGYVLEATSSPTASKALARSGVSNGALSFASVESNSTVKALSGGAVNAIASTAANGVNVGPLTISSFASEAEARLDESGRITLSSSISTGELAVNGVDVGLTDRGLTLAGTQVPLPSGGPLASALVQAGISLTYLVAQRTQYGVIAPGMAITFHQTDPNNKPLTITYTLGQAAASATPSVGGSFSDVGSLSSFSGPSGASTESGSSGSSPGSVGATTGHLTDGARLDGNASLLTGPNLGTRTTNGSSTASRLRTAGRSLAAVRETLPGGLFYLLLVMAAAAALGVGQLMRFLGVRWARSSG